MLFNQNAMSSGAAGYQITNSVRFTAASTQQFTRTPSVAGNQQKWTISAWIKRTALGTAFPILNEVTSTTNNAQIGINVSDQFFFRGESGGTVTAAITSTMLFRDPSAWYHIVFALDTTLAGSTTDRGKLYVNGVAQSYTVGNAINQNNLYFINRNSPHSIGYDVQNNAYNDGYIAELNFIDGQQLLPTDFGEFDTATGVWKAKRYTGTYGTNGFYLDFKTTTSATTLGNDKSGNGNNWTPSNIVTTAGTTDNRSIDVPAMNGAEAFTRPASNYPVINVLSQGTTVSSGGLTFTTLSSYGGANQHNASMVIPNSGKYYFEITVVTVGTTTGSDRYFGLSAGQDGTATASKLVYLGSGQKFVDTAAASAYGATWGLNDILGCAVDVDGGTVTFYKNGVSQGALTYNAAGYYIFASDALSTTTMTYAINFGQREFAYSIPSGFVTLCAANLPAPSIANGNQYMDATLYTGTGSALSVTNANGFSPDLVWIKSRSAATGHALYDTVRGATLELVSNATSAETTEAQGVTAFNSNGFSIGTFAKLNTSAATYVAWQWDAGSSTVTNTSGTITSQVRANTTAGFSIVTYTGTGANATVGHGLGVAPKMIIVKNRTTAALQWAVYHSNLSSAANWLNLNATAAESAKTGAWNSTAPTSSVFSIGTATDTNQSTNNFVAYCFAEIAGFSKIGSYIGNGSADGTFVYCGFRPKFVMIKRQDAADNWVIFDAARGTINPNDVQLAANLTTQEGQAGTTGNPTDLVSNGFKLRASGTRLNASASTYIFIAFAENPFKYANAR